MKDTDLSNYNDLRNLYTSKFSLGNLNSSLEEKLALIAMICYVTNSINKKRSDLDKVTCFQIICKIGKEFNNPDMLEFFKSLGVICEDFMYGCTDFPTFGIEPKAMPKEILKLLNKWMPF